MRGVLHPALTAEDVALVEKAMHDLLAEMDRRAGAEVLVCKT